MFWGKGPDKPDKPAEKPADDAKATGAATGASGAAGVSSLWSRSKDRDAKEGEPSFDENKLPTNKKLPKNLQKIVDHDEHDENFYDEIVSGYAPDSTESGVRYAAYAARLRTILLSAHRYVAYTSDVGESFRPVAHPVLVRAAYGVSWAYILGDVSYEGYKAYWQNQRRMHPDLRLTPRQSKIAKIDAVPSPTTDPPATVPALEDYRTVMAQRAIFQSLASMGLPAFTIHSVVRYSGQALKGVKNQMVRTWAPIGLGLSVVPLLPRMFDEPVENAVEWVFYKGFEAVGGQAAVSNAPATGREKSLNKRPDKEL